MERVGIDVEAGPWRIAFQGRRGFYEQWIEPLVESVITRAENEGSVEVAGEAGEAPAAATPAPAAVEVAPSHQAPRPAAPAVDMWKPEAPAQFHQFVAQVGDRAATTDKKVMAFAFYLWNYEKREQFETAEVQRFFRTVLDESGDDVPQVLEELTHHRGFLDTLGTDGPWSLRKKGVGFVKARLLGQL
ncbi:MAG: hypothetical protein KDB73_13200 [Planctomycetes bacterium]|nr:hypothetical protein [Planctomycetota bacterium]